MQKIRQISNNERTCQRNNRQQELQIMCVVSLSLSVCVLNAIISSGQERSDKLFGAQVRDRIAGLEKEQPDRYIVVAGEPSNNMIICLSCALERANEPPLARQPLLPAG